MDIKYTNKVKKIGEGDTYKLLIELTQESIEELIDWLKENHKFQLLFSVYTTILEFLQVNRFNSNSDKEEKKYFMIGLECISFYSRNVIYEGQEVLFKFGNDNISLKVTQFEDTSLDWENAIYLAVISRKEHALLDVLSLDFNSTNFPEISIGHKYRKAFIQFLLEYLRDDSINNSLLKVMEEQYELAEEVIAEFKPDYSYWIYLYRPLIKLIQGLHKDEEKSFNIHLIKALEHHRNFWSSSRPMNPGGPAPYQDYEGLISLPCTALASMAFDKGWKLDVKSDYMPAFMIDGTINF
jgi:hypothetical protein